MSTPQKTKVSASKKWMQISIRRMLVVLLFFVAIFGYWTNAERRQRKAVAVIEEMGGKVTLVNQFFPEWLNRFGPHYFCTATEVDLNSIQWRAVQRRKNEAQRDETFDVNRFANAVSSLPSCRKLRVSLIGLRDDDIAKLRPLADQIETLELKGFFSGSGLTHLRDWTRLKELYFSRNYNGKDADLKQLSTCPKLDHIRLFRLQLSKEDFEDLARCEHLTQISLSSCSFEGESLRLLQSLKGLKTLSLTNCCPNPCVVSESLEEIPLGKIYNFVALNPQYGAESAWNDPSDKFNEWQKRTLPNVDISVDFYSSD